uniref:Uncharacterized protein n=1 Tax=Strigamia maritima TaxID=126957 RepID=T1JCD3_STRMM
MATSNGNTSPYIANAISSHPLLLVISLDGFRADYLDRYKDVTPNLHEIADTGIRSPWMENVFVTKTLPNHQTIATGVYVESHGIIANRFFDPGLKENFTSNLPDAKWWDTGPTTPIWILNQQASEDRKSGGMMWPGIKASFKNQTAFYGVPYYQRLNKSNIRGDMSKLTDEVISWILNDTNPANLVLLYIPEPDLTGHEFGPNSEEMGSTLYQLDQSIGYLKKSLIDADLYSKLNIIILSDHGMAEVTPEKIIVLEEILNHSYTTYGESPAYAIYPDPGQENFVYETFKNASIYYNETIKIYKKEDIPTAFHYKNNNRIPPYLLVAEEGYDILHFEEAKNKTRAYGNHGYNNSLKSMHALFIAHGPAFKSGVVVPPVQIVDVYPLMCHILRLIPERSNGSLARTVSFLRNPFGLHVTNRWLIGTAEFGIILLLFVCSVLDEYEDANKGNAAKMLRARQNRSGEENSYLLLTSSTDD